MKMKIKKWNTKRWKINNNCIEKCEDRKMKILKNENTKIKIQKIAE